MSILTFYVLKHVPKTTHSCIVELNQKNCQNKYCWTYHLLWNEQQTMRSLQVIIKKDREREKREREKERK